MDNTKNRIINLVAVSADFCSSLENASDLERPLLTRRLLRLLTRIYFEFLDIEAPEDFSVDDWGMTQSSPSKLDEAQYEYLRSNLASVFAEDDTYLETFERDMKYSDTPIASSISENLADIYQPLYDFVVEVRESEGVALEEAFRQAQDAFSEYWSQTLVNVLRPLNALRQI